MIFKSTTPIVLERQVVSVFYQEEEIQFCDPNDLDVAMQDLMYPHDSLPLSPFHKIIS
jgi:hypothetical protein